MKYLILLLLITSNAFASLNICDYQETWELQEALEAAGIKTSKLSSNHKKYTFSEKQMIHLAVSQQSYLSGITREEAISNFADIGYDGLPSSNAGEIKYYKLNGAEMAIVHYYPGDNEFGAIFSIKPGARAPKMIATIDDSFITCR